MENLYGSIKELLEDGFYVGKGKVQIYKSPHRGGYKIIKFDKESNFNGDEVFGENLIRATRRFCELNNEPTPEKTASEQ